MEAEPPRSSAAPTSQPAERASPQEIADLAPLVGHILRSRLGPHPDLDDLVQEALSRLLVAREHLAPEAAAGYAVAVARNLATAEVRRTTTARRHAHKLVDRRTAEDPADVAQLEEEAAELRRALTALRPEDRSDLVAHDAHGVATAVLADRSGTTAGGVASRLHRTRARLRLELVLTQERAELTDPRCRTILLALAAGDRRRQRALDAGGHLAHCATCDRLAPLVLQRRSVATALAPGALLVGLLRSLRHIVRVHPATAAVAGATAAGAVAAAVAASAASPPPVAGYLVAGGNGTVSATVGVRLHGSEAGRRLDGPVTGVAATPDGHGYWLTAADGGVFAFGDAPFLGSAAPRHPTAPVVGIAATPDGHGYWLAAADGTVTAFGNARDLGSEAGRRLDAPVTGVAATPDGHGYWLTAADGGVFAFGDAPFLGSAAPRHPTAPVVGIAATPDGHGYWLAAADGTVIAFGTVPAPRPGPAPAGRLVGIAAGRRAGYVVLTAAGRVVTSGGQVLATRPPLGGAPRAVAPGRG